MQEGGRERNIYMYTLDFMNLLTLPYTPKGDFPYQLDFKKSNNQC